MEITCGRCKSKWTVNDLGAQNLDLKKVVECPVCGFNKKDINESRDERKVLKG